MSQEFSANNKRIAKNTLLLYLRSVFLILINLYTSRVILQALGVQDYGIYNVVGGMVTMFTMLSNTMASASQRFITYALGERDSDKLKKVFTTSITLHAVLGFIIIFLIESVGVWFLYNKLSIPTERLDVAFWVLQFSIATLFVNIISVPFNATIIAHERMSAFAYISILDGVLKLAIAMLILLTSADRLILYAALMFAVALLLRFIYSIYSHRHFEETRHIRLHIEHGLFREMFSFAGWNLFGNGSALLRNQGIDILLNMFFGVTVNAAKGVSNQVLHAITQFVQNFQTAVNPQLTMSVAQSDTQRTHFLIMQGGRFSFFLLCLFVIPLIMVTPQVLSLWLVEVPQWAVEFIRWTLIYQLWDTLSRFLVTAMLATGEIRNYQIVVGGTKLLAVPMAYVWLLLGGSPLVGIWVNIILELACLGLRLYFNANANGLRWKTYLTGVVLRCWVVFVMAIGLSYMIKDYLTSNFILLIVASLVLTVLSISIIGMDKSERLLVLSKASSFISKHRIL